MPHVVLLGDSVFDNGAYVAGGPDVIHQLRSLLPPDWQATLLAVDGSTTATIASQLAQLPPDATHLVLSVGGNDALQASDFLQQTSTSVADTLLRLAEIGAAFAQTYTGMLAGVLACGVPTALSTVYDPRFSGDEVRALTRTALLVFNDAIYQAALQHRLPLLEMRRICAEDSDFANPIEPSVAGGAKIAAAIARLVTDSNSSPTCVYC